MRKNILLIAAFVGTLFLASCGENKDASIMKQADDMYATAEENIQGVEDFDAFFASIEELDQKKNEFLTEVLAPAYAVGDTAFNVPEEVSNHIFERATAYNHVEGAKFAELFTPYVDNLENATEAVYQAKSKAEKDALIEKAMEAYEALMPFADYDNVPPEMQERVGAIVEKLDAIL